MTNKNPTGLPASAGSEAQQIRQPNRVLILSAGVLAAVEGSCLECKSISANPELINFHGRSFDYGEYAFAQDLSIRDRRT